MRDAIVIGGGIAGMSAAWRLRHSDVLVLEGSNRIGGRLRSERRGAYWLNWGGHVFGGEGSFADKLLKEVGVDALNLQGSFAALAAKEEWTEEDWEEELYATLAHEFTHHMEGLAGERGLDLKDEAFLEAWRQELDP